MALAIDSAQVEFKTPVDTPEVSLVPSKQSNVFEIVVDRTSFPKGADVFSRLEIVQVTAGGEILLASSELGGGQSVDKDGNPVNSSGLSIWLGYSYGKDGKPIFSRIADPIKARLVHLESKPIACALSLKAADVTFDVPDQHHSVAIVQSGNFASWANVAGNQTIANNTAIGSDLASYGLVAIGTLGGPPATVSATYDGVAQTNIASQVGDWDGISNGAISEVYRLVAPNTTSNANEVIRTNPTAGSYGHGAVLILSGVDQTTPEDTPVTGVGIGNVGAGAVTTPSSGLTFDCVFLDSSTTTPAASHTQVINDSQTPPNFYFMLHQDTQSAGSQTLAWTNVTPLSGSGSIFDHWMQCIIPVRASGGAAATIGIRFAEHLSGTGVGNTFPGNRLN